MAKVEVASYGKTTGLCESSWGDNDCPNRATVIMKVKDSFGFAIMCDPHSVGFYTVYNSNEIDEIPFTTEEAEKCLARLDAALAPYQEAAEKKVCRWCKAPLVGKIEFYAHAGGYSVKGGVQKLWIYTVCPRCDYSWAMQKLGIPEFPVTEVSDEH